MVIFQSTPSARRATAALCTVRDELKISIHALREEGDASPEHQPPSPRGISIHALREEGDCRPIITIVSTINFNPRPPRGGRPARAAEPPSCKPFQSTPSARRATLWMTSKPSASRISIHALREEGDNRHSRPSSRSKKFQSTPSARRATRYFFCCVSFYIFQSTPSARRATDVG